jgi:rSAM/selenodomain-associated transferase 1
VESRCLIVFTKPAVAGRVKTRLVGDLSPDQAAALHGALLEDLREALADAPFETRLAWALDPEQAMPESREVAWRQSGDDLGERMYRALAAAAADHDAVAVIGSDHPGFDRQVAEHAFAALAEAHLAIVPAFDGGYSLLAVRASALRSELFSGIAWSTPAVLDETLARAAALGLRVARLAPLADLDDPRQLAELCARLAAGERAAGSRVRRLLESWGRGPALVAS